MNPTPQRTLAIVATVSLLGLATGCNGTSSASPVPTAATSVPTLPATATPSASASSKPSAPSAAEAEQVYRKAFSEMIRLGKAGGVAPGSAWPTSLTDVTAEQALEDIGSQLNQVAQQGIKTTGEATITAVKPNISAGTTTGSTITLNSCEDGRKLSNKLPDGTVNAGALVFSTQTFRVVEGKLKMVTYSGKRVDTCPIK